MSELCDYCKYPVDDCHCDEYEDDTADIIDNWPCSACLEIKCEYWGGDGICLIWNED